MHGGEERGIVGMFLCVPIMMLMMIICANVPSWRWVAVLLSKDGRIETPTHDMSEPRWS